MEIKEAEKDCLREAKGLEVLAWRMKISHLFGPVDVDYAEKRTRLASETFAAWERRKVEYEREDEEMGLDFYAIQAEEFYASWSAGRFRLLGPFEATTKIPPMRFTDKPAPPNRAYACDTLQIYSVKVAGIRAGLQWPLDVFGLVAMRDSIDHNRNVIFSRTRDNCQTLTKMDPYLVLTGPTRAVMLSDRVTTEVLLKVKGATESEDKDFSFLAVPVIRRCVLNSCLFNATFPRKLSTLEFAFGQIVFSVEATIFVQVVDGSWPDGFRGQFFARASSIDNQKVTLLDSGVGKAPVISDGKIKLSRCVASVEVLGKLIVSVKAWQIVDKVVDDEMDFIPKETGRSHVMLDVGFCKMEVTVAWSLISPDPAA